MPAASLANGILAEKSIYPSIKDLAIKLPLGITASHRPTLIPTRTSGSRREFRRFAPVALANIWTDREAEHGVEFIREQANTPFLLYMAHYAVHTPIQAKRDLVEAYEAVPRTNDKVGQPTPQ